MNFLSKILFLSFKKYVFSRSTFPEAGESPAVGVGGPKMNPQQSAAQKRLQQTQAQVDEV